MIQRLDDLYACICSFTPYLLECHWSRSYRKFLKGYKNSSEIGLIISSGSIPFLKTLFSHLLEHFFKLQGFYRANQNWPFWGTMGQFSQGVNPCFEPGGQNYLHVVPYFYQQKHARANNVRASRSLTHMRGATHKHHRIRTSGEAPIKTAQHGGATTRDEPL